MLDFSQLYDLMHLFWYLAVRMASRSLGQERRRFPINVFAENR